MLQFFFVCALVYIDGFICGTFLPFFVPNLSLPCIWKAVLRYCGKLLVQQENGSTSEFPLGRKKTKHLHRLLGVVLNAVIGCNSFSFVRRCASMFSYVLFLAIPYHASRRLCFVAFLGCLHLCLIVIDIQASLLALVHIIV